MKNVTEILTGKSNGAHVPLIAGPCSAESYEQLRTTVLELREISNLIAVRAGVWKPRTRPGSFEGIGEHALQWIQKIKEETGLKFAVEVANSWQTEAALRAGIDILWIGARTTVNPFYVQEIAEVLRGIDVPVMVKNPIHADLGLWIGGVERLRKVGIRRIVAVHRGFFTSGTSVFRNDPKWEIPVEFRTHMPDVPIVCDPSHISGKRDYIFEISQAALDLEMDGLMIESHYRPDQALSDAEQQVTPAELKEIMTKLVRREELPENTEALEHLYELRHQIDALDHQILNLLEKRKHLVESIGELKRDHNITILQFQRWFEIVKDRSQLARILGLDEDVILEIFQLIHRSSIKIQQQILQGKTTDVQ
ncbi:cytochrome c4 [Thermaurantimonas aggregans]|uniref:chorismate mutase n=1 Tax=Thermaurantimonas aggregans TaxID=2173829 RepID=A0A401XLN3_9FLAO|nr:cytochrome c4 [Thermaurantimonas aggregans]